MKKLLLALPALFSAFFLSAQTFPNCENPTAICGVQNYPNTTGAGNFGPIGCLFTTPNPTFFILRVSEPGLIKLSIAQYSLSNPGTYLDVDYVGWGPFSSPDGMCEQTITQAALTGTTTGCSYSANATEQFHITNAVAGEYYLLMTTNFSNVQGFLNITVDPTSTGAIDCTGIRMQAFLDGNNNGTKDDGEVDFPLGQFNYEVNNDGTVSHAVSSTGIYTIYDHVITNSYDLGFSILPEYAAAYGASTNYSGVLPATGLSSTYYFPVTSLAEYSDLAVSLVPFSAPRAGAADYRNKIIYTNYGNTAIAQGTLTFTHDPALSVNEVSEPGAVANANGFSFIFTDLQPFESRTITVTMSVPTIPTVSIGQLLINNASVGFAGNDLVADNDSSSVSQAVIAAYDPNDKTESHGDKILLSAFDADDYLYYTIRFENVGNTFAQDITVTDLLDAKIDETSFAMVSATHPYTVVRNGNSLSWNFDDIILPVSVPDSEIGKGALTFKVRLKPGFALGDVIPNTAMIYFDANPAIVTNTFLTEFVSTLGNAAFDEASVTIYPNPAQSSVSVSIVQSDVIESIALYDLVGKLVKMTSGVSASQTTIDISELSKGVYLIETVTGNRFRIVKKLIVQ